MKKLCPLLLLILSACATVAAPPSEESVQTLLQLTESQKLVEGMVEKMDLHLKTSMEQGMGNIELSTRERQVLDKTRAKMVSLMTEQLDWAKMEPDFVHIYVDSFTQDEVNGMITFYKSDAGRAVTQKMPIVMQHTMALMQKMQLEMMPKLQEIQQEMKAEWQPKADTN